MPDPVVTVAIPTRNRLATFFPATLGSALAQTYPHMQIIVSDNCSDDETGLFVREVGDSRIEYFRHPEDIGANENFNFCVQKSEGDFFLLLCDDDLIDPDFLSVCIGALGRGSHPGIIRTGTRIIDERGAVSADRPNRVRGPRLVDWFRSWFSDETSLYLCSTLFHTPGLKALGGFQSRRNLFQDAGAMVRLASLAGRLEINDVKASFRMHSHAATFSARVQHWCEDSLQLLDIMCDLVPEEREIVRREGRRFFARLNIRRAQAVKNPIGRLLGYASVLRTFGFRHLSEVPGFR